MSQRIVEVAGVRVPMYSPDDRPGFSPMRIALGLVRQHPSESFGGAPEEDALAAIDALQEAGVKWLPLYEKDAREAGIRWAEVGVEDDLARG